MDNSDMQFIMKAGAAIFVCLFAVTVFVSLFMRGKA